MEKSTAHRMLELLEDEMVLEDIRLLTLNEAEAAKGILQYWLNQVSLIVANHKDTRDVAQEAGPAPARFAKQEK